MKTVLLHAGHTNQLSYFDDWVDAFNHHSAFDTQTFNVFEKQDDHNQLIKTIESAEVTILHHSMNGDTLEYLMPFIAALKNRKGKLVSFVGNEINLPTIGMAPKINVLKELEADIIATQLLQEAGDWLYADCYKSQVFSIPHALNPKAFYPTHEYQQRKTDIGTRSARYSVYMGDNDRNDIIQFFYHNASEYSLSVDLGLEKGCQQRFNRQEWAQFLNSCKATLSTEAGSFYLERDDKLVNSILEHLKSSSSKYVLPNDPFLRNLYRRLVPTSIRKQIINLSKNRIVEVENADQDVNFLYIYEKFFSSTSKCPVYSKAISSRHFDAIGTKTLHIMYPGRYNDILTPQEHYFPLKKDLSNIEELLDLIRNPIAVQKIVDQAYDHVITHHTHKHRLDYLASVLTNERA